jgi:hypothetical protein
MSLSTVLLCRHVDVGRLAPGRTWARTPGKLLSAYAEGAAVALTGLRLLTQRKHPGRRRLFLREAIPARRR